MDTRIDRDDVVNLEDLLRLALIYEECGNAKLVIDRGELARNVKEVRHFTSL